VADALKQNKLDQVSTLTPFVASSAMLKAAVATQAASSRAGSAHTCAARLKRRQHFHDRITRFSRGAPDRLADGELSRVQVRAVGN